MSTHLQKITAEAKRLRKKHPNMKWTSLIKLASKKVKPAAKKKGRVGAAPKKAAKKTKKRIGAYKVVELGEKRSSPARVVYRQVRNKSGEFKGMQTVGSMINQAKSIIISQLAKLEVKKYMASTKREKSSIQKLITEKKAQLRRLK